MTDDYSIDREMLDVCTDVLTSLDSRGIIDGAAFVELFPDNGTVIQLPIEHIPDTVVDDWRGYPRLVQAHFREALPQLADDPEGDIPQQAGDEASVRITGFTDDELYDVGQYSPDDVVDSVIHLRGQVTKRSGKRLRDEVIAFECERCGRVTRIPQSGSDLTEPADCPGCERQGPYRVNEGQTVTRDYQNIELQTLAEEAVDGETETITMNVFDEHVGELAPGDRCVLTVDIKGERVGQNSRVRVLVGDVLGITHLETDYSDVEIGPYEEEIRQFANGEHPDYPEFDSPHEAIIASIAPGHTGDEHIKEAISYLIFGGVEKELPDGTWMRGNSHVLLMGDPGTGKTTIIEYITELVPRSEYGTGKGSTSAGLTATVQKDDFEGGDGWSLEAGMVVKANNGVAAIDELDKMNKEDRDGLMEAMSQQRITVSMVKSGTMPAKTAILAAANPKYGSFDPMEDIGHQLDLDPVILSRFDLWFVMMDEVDEEQDEAIADDVLTQARAGERIEADKEVEETEWDEPPIPPEMFRAYVSMGKNMIPELTEDAMESIKSEYVEIRQSNDKDGPVPTTARTITGLVRLAEASARMRLGERVTQEDVDRAVNIHETSMETLGVDPETGELDAARIETGVGASSRDRLKGLKTIIRTKKPSSSEPAPQDEVESAALDVMDEDAFEHTLQKLKDRGEVYQPGGPGTLDVTD